MQRVADKNNNLEPFPPDFFYVIAGTREGGTEPSDGTIHQVKTVFRHPKFKGVNSDTNGHHDVGLLELVDEIELGEKSQLVELAHEDDRPAVGTDCKLAGWGKNPDHPGDKSLYQIHFNIISSQECYDEFASDEVDELEKHEICAQAPGRNECPGDSGGPLIDTTTNRQIGIVSYGAFDCTSDDTPGVLTRVTDNLDYINEIKAIRRNVAGCGYVPQGVTNEQTLEQYPPEFFHVISGTREGSVNPTNGTIHDVKAVFHHPKYEGLNSKSRAHNDVALLQLVDNIELGETSQLVELAHENERPAIGTKCKLAGWGKNPDHPDDPDLYQIYFNVISTLECYLYYPADSLIGLWKHEICAKAPGKNQCQGDSGGPLIDTTTNRQVGIVSYGRQDCTTGAPGVLARVTDNLNYINETLNAIRFCYKMSFNVAKEISNFLKMKLKLIGLVVFSTILLNSSLAQERIYGGEPIDITDAPYMVHLYHRHSADPDDHKISLCGGVTDKNNNLEQFPPDFFHVISGTREGSPHPSEGKIHEVKTVFHHPKYQGIKSKSHAHHDVALLELVDEIELSDKSQLIDLAHEDDRPAVGTECKLAGWGKNPDHPDDKDLYQIHYNIVSSEDCYKAYHFDKPKELEKHEICAHAEGKNQCQGDSGGPMIDTTTNRQIGIVSYGDPDCTTDKPGVLVRVTDNLDYINEIIAKTNPE
ncbi:Trypsin-1 [Pseudolycoriella hygida]|uniref:Trypsin-1 n=1 Tax=Pseudolycoriella hygida TaxID=35572 RepID=A0A9Q0MHH4_9DIPT|nr:Trypsin-1 [Pseudolycoriella hygida]